MLWDTHMHTDFSGDSDASPKEMAQQAIRLQLEGICITDHLDYDYPNEPELFLLDLDRYVPSILNLKETYQGRLDIRLGIEIGVQPHLAEKHKQIVSSLPFDQVIGSSHTAKGMDPYYPEYFYGSSQEDAYIRYFSSVMENISCFTDFDVYGHLDYVTRYGNSPVPAYTFDSCRKQIDEILKRLIRLEKALEINTGGFSSACRQVNPHPEILKRYYELGGRIVTFGSDAHAPKDIARQFAQAGEILRNCGFREYCSFQNRSPVFHKL